MVSVKVRSVDMNLADTYVEVTVRQIWNKTRFLKRLGNMLNSRMSTDFTSIQ
jgi:hypothetical protein